MGSDTFDEMKVLLCVLSVLCVVVVVAGRRKFNDVACMMHTYTRNVPYPDTAIVVGQPPKRGEEPGDWDREVVQQFFLQSEVAPDATYCVDSSMKVWKNVVDFREDTLDDLERDDLERDDLERERDVDGSFFCGVETKYGYDEIEMDSKYECYLYRACQNLSPLCLSYCDGDVECVDECVGQCQLCLWQCGPYGCFESCMGGGDIKRSARSVDDKVDDFSSFFDPSAVLKEIIFGDSLYLSRFGSFNADDVLDRERSVESEVVPFVTARDFELEMTFSPLPNVKCRDLDDLKFG